MKTKTERAAVLALRGLVAAIEAHLTSLDAVMRDPSTPERGRKIAALANALDMAKDHVRFGVLGVDFRTGRPRRRTAP